MTNVMAVETFTGTQVPEVGNKILFQTKGGGEYSGTRVMVLHEDQKIQATLPIGSSISFDAGFIHTIGYTTPTGRSPEGFMEVAEVVISEINSEQFKGIVPCLEFDKGEQRRRLLMHYVCPGQTATILRIGP